MTALTFRTDMKEQPQKVNVEDGLVWYLFVHLEALLFGLTCDLIRQNDPLSIFGQLMFAYTAVIGRCQISSNFDLFPVFSLE